MPSIFEGGQEKEAIVRAVHHVISPAHHPFLVEEGERERAFPGVAAVVGKEESGGPSVDVFHADCEGEIRVG